MKARRTKALALALSALVLAAFAAERSEPMSDVQSVPPGVVQARRPAAQIRFSAEAVAPRRKSEAVAVSETVAAQVKLAAQAVAAALAVRVSGSDVQEASASVRAEDLVGRVRAVFGAVRAESKAAAGRVDPSFEAGARQAAAVALFDELQSQGLLAALDPASEALAAAARAGLIAADAAETQPASASGALDALCGEVAAQTGVPAQRVLASLALRQAQAQKGGGAVLAVRAASALAAVSSSSAFQPGTLYWSLCRRYEQAQTEEERRLVVGQILKALRSEAAAPRIGAPQKTAEP